MSEAAHRLARTPLIGVAWRLLANTMAGLSAPFRALVTYRQLVRLLIRREIQTRTSDTVLGGLWVLLQPALQVLAFWFLLDLVLQVRFPGRVGFLDYFLVGMIPWLMLSEIMTMGLGALTQYAPLFRRALFPLAIIPLMPLLVSGAVYGAVYTVAVFALEGAGAAAKAPFLIVALLIWLLPVLYILAVVGLFIRDARQAVRFILTLMLYATPILYRPDMLPEALQAWQAINPFADLMAIIHAVLQDMPLEPWQMLRPLLWWLMLLGPGWVLFKRTEPYMREAL